MSNRKRPFISIPGLGAKKRHPGLPFNITVPTISGTAQQGQTLTANPGTWSNLAFAYAYQWYRGGSVVGGATGQTYALAAADVGYVMSVRVWATNSYGQSNTAAQSAGTSAVAAASSGGVPKITAEVTVLPNAGGGQQALWMGWYEYRQREFDRLVNDEFYGALMWQPDVNWPVGPVAGETWLNYSGSGEFYGGDSRCFQGKWGRVWNFHNADKELGGAGWDYNPGWSACAMDFINGNLTWCLEDNSPNNYMLVPWSQMQLGHRYTIAIHLIMGRVNGADGTRQGVLEVWVDGVKKLDLQNINTIYRFTVPVTSIQRYYWMWTGFYTSSIHAGYQCRAKAAFPFTGTSIAAMKAEAAGGEGEAGTPMVAGFSHFSDPSYETQVFPSWSSADLVLPPGW